MLDRARAIAHPSAGDQFGGRPRDRARRSVPARFADAVEVGVVTPDQLDEDRLFGFEVVVEAAREDACRIGYLLQ